MPKSTTVTDYINSVCGQIRWKKAHENIKTELINHIEDQKSAYIEQDIPKEQAEQQAIKDMGDPITIGTEFDRVYRPKTNWGIIIITFILLFAGMVVRQIIQMNYPHEYSLPEYFLSTLIGVVVLIAAYFFDYSRLTKYPLIIYAGFIIAIILVRNNIYPQPDPFTHPQPDFGAYYVRYLALLFPLLFSGIIYLFGGKKIIGFLACGAVAVFTILMFLFISSFASAAIAAISGVIMLTFAIAADWFKCNKIIALFLMYIPVFAALLIVCLKYIQQPIERGDSWGKNYVNYCIENIFSGAKFIGQGSADLSKYKLPAVNTDYMLAGLIHSIGWISLIVVVLLVALLVAFGIRICIKQTSFSGRLTAISVVSIIALQALLYIVSNLGIINLSSFPLPFIYGQSSIITNMFLVGILLSVTRYSKIATDKVVNEKKSRIFNYSDGKITIDLKNI